MLSVIYVDADACPVKQEIYRVAKRYGFKVILVANTWMRTPSDSWLELRVVDDHPDAADDWIVENAVADDILVTADIPLAARCVKNSVSVLSPRGRLFTQESIVESLANQELMSHIRDMGTMTGGPPPFDDRDRSHFLQRLDQTIQAIRRNQ
ncbi:MAG TPA: YaiI/YqxD family protein [Candidatus Latescibacteria bacterium]|nr:hypothetical protein [Gemmatimonadota bacterium]HCR15928.1 YaiI/YqxD family protein [Candidatus Latescibacterota bacterium]